MTDADISEFADEALAVLVSRANLGDETAPSITYGALGEAIGFPGPYNSNHFGKSIGRILGVMGHKLDRILVDGFRPPMIQALAVAKGSGLPSDGLAEFYPDYRRLQNDKKRDFALRERQRVAEFGSRWGDVLRMLSIEASAAGNLGPRLSMHNGRINPFGALGSPEHIALRDYIAANPGLVGADVDAHPTVEFPLRSGDSVDVAFKSAGSIVGVECKSRRSGEEDLMRGLFQCIKYQSVLEAECRADGIQLRVATCLVTESLLPARIKKVAKLLGVTYYHGVAVD